jgi:hypothetical protein
MMFEQATKQKVRFQTIKGHLSTEDLWDLPLIELNVLAKELNRSLKGLEDEDFITTDTKLNREKELFQLKFDVVRHVIAVKIEERDAKTRAKELAERNKLIQEIIFNKQNAELENKSVEELKAMLVS